jgi:CRISPR-associated protein Csb2
MPEFESQIEKCLVGRKTNGDDAAPKSARVRIVPLPSIGHFHADHAIRRVLVEIPAGCLIRADDAHWAFSGLELTDPEMHEVPDILVIPSPDETMLRHYGVGNCNSTKWRTVTPAALPELARRRRIEPSRRSSEVKGGAERAREQARAAASVILALRHAEVRAQVDTMRVQREPFEGKGERVEAFAPGTRFAKERLWHVEITFVEPISGPLLIGDGRYFGLGLMAPVESV